MELYLVCEKTVEYTGVVEILIDKIVLKIFRELESAKNEMEHRAKMLVASDHEWRKIDTNGSSFIDLAFGNTTVTKRYYIIQKHLED